MSPCQARPTYQVRYPNHSVRPRWLLLLHDDSPSLFEYLGAL